MEIQRSNLSVGFDGVWKRAQNDYISYFIFLQEGSDLFSKIAFSSELHQAS